MQAMFHERERVRVPPGEQRDDSRTDRTESKIITRKQALRPNNNIFKKRKDDQELPSHKDKRCHSSHQLKFDKHASAEDRDPTPTSHDPTNHDIHQNHQQENRHRDSNRNSPIKQSPKLDKKKSLVFNKFTHREKDQIRESLMEIKNQIDRYDQDNKLRDLYFQIEAYITKIQENNSKLLEVNYFFQKQFNQIMTERQLSKRVEKCSKSNCMECRYHLEKENRWKQEKYELENQITRLKDELTSMQSSKLEECSQTPSIVAEYSGTDSSEAKSVVKLREELEVKDEEYLILLKEFNYLDAINKDLKGRMGRLMEEYKYLSIENRTLLNTKTKLIQKELQCTKYKDERDYFKRKLIDHHHRSEQAKAKHEEANGRNSSCSCKAQEEESIFSLSSASNDLSSLSHANSAEAGRITY